MIQKKHDYGAGTGALVCPCVRLLGAMLLVVAAAAGHSHVSGGCGERLRSEPT